MPPILPDALQEPPIDEIDNLEDIFPNNFNKKYNVNVYKNTYRQIMGEEGEHCDYYTLSDLTNEQKIEFLFPPITFTKTDDVMKGSPVIILPSVINTENKEHINP